MTSLEGSFARFTIINRVPGILADMIAGNSFPPEVEKELKDLENSLPEGDLVPLKEDSPYAEEINRTLRENPGYNWLNGPFLFLENYLYHRISQICGYDIQGRDYFLYRKEAEARRGLVKFKENLKTLPGLDSFARVCLLNLMGNKADLSQNGSYYSSDASFDLLIDSRCEAEKILEKAFRVDIVLDNAGEELFFDLLMAHWLLSRSTVEKVKLHFKSMPYFVSDALISDYRMLLDLLSEQEETSRFSRDLERFEKEGKLELGAHPFFAGGGLYSRMPDDLSKEFSRSDLVIFKGDLNYRRLVGDDMLDYETPTSSLVDYFPADILICRILKCELVVGLTPEVIPHRDKTEWMFNGKYGLIELVPSR